MPDPTLGGGAQPSPSLGHFKETPNVAIGSRQKSRTVLNICAVTMVTKAVAR